MGAAALDLVEKLKQSDEDHEYYPTTDQIIRSLLHDLKAESTSRWRKSTDHSFWGKRDTKGATVLDIGSGDGKVLKAFASDPDLDVSSLYAIEKSAILRARLPHNIFVLGTDFHNQNLVDKSVDVLFCNPPYSEYADWTAKIIRESIATFIYLVIPERWKDNADVNAAINSRGVKVRVVGSYDFLNAEDRRARAKVDLLCVRVKDVKTDDPFVTFFNEHFAEARKKAAEERKRKEEVLEAEARAYVSAADINELVVGVNYPDMLVYFYNRESQRLQTQYSRLAEIDFSDLAELGIDMGTVIGSLKKRLFGLKDKYWRELFSKLDVISKRLTSKNQRLVMDKLVGNVGVDFTLDNITAVLQWVILNANKYADSQLLDVYDTMVSNCNVTNYKSNQKVWIDDRHRYSRDDDNSKHDRFKLEYRIVMTGKGGIWHKDPCAIASRCGLKEEACMFLKDLLTVANNLGFVCDMTDTRLQDPYRDPNKTEERPIYRYDWKPNTTYEFRCKDRKGKDVVLFDVRAHYIGTMHIRFNQDFMRTLNVEYGRLRGWLKSGKEAAEEMNDPKAADLFGSMLYLGDTSTLLLR